MGCIFCKIIHSEIPSEIVYQDDRVVAFNDSNPQAPTHILICPRKHIATLNELTEDDTQLVGHMIQSGQRLAKQMDLAEGGYRLVFNCNPGAGQTVYHIHLHLLGGRKFSWPPG